MKIATKFVSPMGTTGPHFKTLIQTELGTYFILDEDLLSGDIVSERVSAEDARQFEVFSKSSAQASDGLVSENGWAYEHSLHAFDDCHLKIP